MIHDATTRAWVALSILSAASVMVASTTGTGVGGSLSGAVILLFAWVKARIVLARYLGLWQAPGWLAGFNWVLGFYCLLLLGLFLVPELTR
ncbi:cytochrome C oxidase subunit IV family protein [Roseibium aggregatum]|uniref:Cytochrome C oxidase subunit IV family protein n=1 Tax=Roseibium aggregatum TaxID=187304 RepID=A0A939J6D6_9HYPH|nr:cytochrome C oxidase subunit IV family protein [Roseibium aggregatum]MBN9672689.1 cytochrome C oxidase subunit IV family protein [Roseibium aggregatum]